MAPMSRLSLGWRVVNALSRMGRSNSPNWIPRSLTKRKSRSHRPRRRRTTKSNVEQFVRESRQVLVCQTLEVHCLPDPDADCRWDLRGIEHSGGGVSNHELSPDHHRCG